VTSALTSTLLKTRAEGISFYCLLKWVSYKTDRRVENLRIDESRDEGRTVVNAKCEVLTAVF